MQPAEPQSPRRRLLACRRGLPRRRNQRGAVELELVIVVPALMMIVLFVVWAGRVGNAGLAAELAAEEAAVAAALSDPDDREAAARAVLESRPELKHLCIGGPTPTGSGEYVTAVQRDFTSTAGVARGIGIVGVTLRCETDGAVPVVRGLTPTVVHYGRGSEPFLVAGRAELPVIRIPEIAIRLGVPERALDDDPALDDDSTAASVHTLFIELVLEAPVVEREVTIVATTKQPPDWKAALPAEFKPSDTAIGGDSFGGGGCATPADRSVPIEHTGYYDYRHSTRALVISPGETRVDFQIPLVDDCIHEAPEQFPIYLTAIGATFDRDRDGTPNQEPFAITLTDNDPEPLVRFVISDHGYLWRDCGITPQQHSLELSLPESSGSLCLPADFQLELRHRDEPEKRVVSGNPLSRFTVISRDKASGAGNATGSTFDAAIDCTADYTSVDEPVTVRAAFGDPTGRLTGDASDDMLKYNVFAPPGLSITPNDDMLDEPNERFALIIAPNSLQAVDDYRDLDQNDVYHYLDGSETVYLPRRIEIVIIDNDEPPQLAITAPDFASNVYVRNTPRATFDTQGFKIEASLVGSMRSQHELPVFIRVAFDYSDFPDNSDPADGGSHATNTLGVRLDDPRAIKFPNCQPNNSMEFNLRDVISGLTIPHPSDPNVSATGDRFLDTNAITKIDFALCQARANSRYGHPRYKPASGARTGGDKCIPTGGNALLDTYYPYTLTITP